jgi:hopanoid biosynthesis associated RND transporter like protein HpnN
VTPKGERVPGAMPSNLRRSTWRDPSHLAESLVGASIRHPWVVVALSLVLTLAGFYVAATRFAITTQTDQLLETNSDWHRHREAFQAAFPQLDNIILAVVDGATPERADDAAAKLTDALSANPGKWITRAWRPDGGPFFDRNGLLFLPVDQVRQTVQQLSEQQPMLSALSGDPTLRGLMRLLQLGAMQGELEKNAGLVGQLTGVIDAVLKGEPARLSWQSLMSGKPADPSRLRRFVLVDPVLDYKALEPSAKSTDRIRDAARELGLTPENGVRVRLTGAPPLADEEFATIAEGAPVHMGLTILAIGVILYLALKSGRVIFAVLATTFAGLIVTVGAGLLMVGRFNVISVAVAALFLGLGVDFGIQVAVRYRDERFKHDDVATALRSAAHGVGWSLTLAAASLLAGFFAFLPTGFTGVAELGEITGVGMIIAFVLSLTLLPALLTLLKPPGEPETVEMSWLAGVDHWIVRHRKLVITLSTLLVVAGLPLLFRLEFDANPMHLRSDKTEGVATFLDLTHTPGMTPNTISVLAPSLDAAMPLAARIAALPEVERAVTARAFVPDGQAEKLAVIREAAGPFESLINPAPPAPPPSDAELVAAIRQTAGALGAEAGASAAQTRLAGTLTRLADAQPAVRAAAQSALTGDLPRLLAGIGALFTAEPITLETLPPTLVDDWLSKTGQARIEVSPKGDANDNAVLDRFAAAVASVSPDVTGAPVDLVESRGIIVRAFITAGVLALAAIFVILTIALRRPRDVALTLGPLVIATILTLEAAHLLGMPLNLANIIALPLMLAVGVNFHIYYMIAWRNGVADMLASSLTVAIFYSSLTTGVAFGSLWLSNHPGTASMGKLLTISLVFTLLAAFIIVPAFLGPPRQEKQAG